MTPDVNGASSSHGIPSAQEGSPSLREPSRWRRTFAALKYPNYRLWFRGQLISLFGTWMQTTAQGFLIFELTRSPLYLGYVGFAAGVPTWLFTLYGGVAADRLSRRTLLIMTQSAMMLLAFVLATLTFLHVVQPWHILCLAFCLGIANAFDAPARQAFVSEMVPKEDLTNAIALNAMMFQSATAVGPAAAGLAYALLGAGWCFTINGLSFIAVIAALRKMNIKTPPPRRPTTSAFAELKEGIRYVATHEVIRAVIALVAATSMLAQSLVTIVPAWAVKVLGGGAATNGFLLSARGVGALAGALVIASLGRTGIRGRFLTVGSFLYPVMLLLFASARLIPLSLLAFTCVGAGTILVLNLANAIVQTSTPDHLRGRVMGAYTWIFFGSMPLGALWLGTAAEHIGEVETVVINAVLALCVAAVIWGVFPKVRKQ
jgi:MFS family permease